MKRLLVLFARKCAIRQRDGAEEQLSCKKVSRSYLYKDGAGLVSLWIDGAGCPLPALIACEFHPQRPSRRVAKKRPAWRKVVCHWRSGRV